jgi:hypothetical protein
MKQTLVIPEPFLIPFEKKKYRFRIDGIRYRVKRGDTGWHLITFKKSDYEVEISISGGSSPSISSIRVNGFSWYKTNYGRYNPKLPQPVISTVNAALATLHIELQRLFSLEREQQDIRARKAADTRKRREASRREHYQELMEALK